MSSWRPRTTKLGGLPHLSHVPRKPEPLGSEFKCTADPVTGCMLALEVQRGKEAMKKLTYNSEYGNTCGCTMSLMELTKGVDAICLGVKGDAWFGSVKNCANLKAKGFESIFQIKQNSALFPKEYVNEILKDAPGGVSIVMSGSLYGIPLIATGYRYSRKTILYFVMSDRAGKTTAGDPYRMKYTDRYGNLCEREVERPDFISKYFNDSNKIDAHNQVRQSELALEKKWPTKDPFFRLASTFIGMCVTDCWKLAFHHKLIDSNRAAFSDDKKTTIQRFAGYLSLQLISCASTLLSESDPIDNIRCVEISSNTDSSLLSDMTKNVSNETVDSIRTLADASKTTHRLCKPPKRDTDGQKKYSMTRNCKMYLENGDRHQVTYYCYDCGMTASYCSPDSFNKERDCFAKHVRLVKKDIPKRGNRK